MRIGTNNKPLNQTMIDIDSLVTCGLEGVRRILLCTE